ncbi:MAG: hypothetical protein ACKV2U_12105 [Bryobacteraceae bacterium]
MTRQSLITAIAFSTLLSADPGKLVLDGKTYVLAHVYARKSPGKFDSKKVSTYVLAVDRELPPATRVDSDAIREMVFEGQLNGVEIELGDDGVSWTIRSRQVQATLSGSQSPDPYKLTVSGGRVQGMVKMEKPSSVGDTEYYFEFPVDAAVEVKVEPPPPTAADKAAAKNSEVAKAYMAYQIVLQKGDKAGMMKAVDPEKAAMIDTPEFPQILKFIQSMQPKNVEVLRAAELGDVADLTVSGNGGADTGTVKMKKLNGVWLVVKESWTSR